MQATTIEWVGTPAQKGYSWNPTSGCSFGCPYCYARRMAHRFKRSFAPACHPERLDQPARLRQPSRIFVDSAGDLFDPAIPLAFIVQVYQMMRYADRHTYFILTKQATRMAMFTEWASARGLPINHLPNVWAGVTLTCQQDADERIPLLLQTKVSHRFVSVEPLLSSVDLYNALYVGADDGIRNPMAGIQWCIIGAQTGPGANSPKAEWVESLTAQCEQAEVPVFHKNNLVGVNEKLLMQLFGRRNQP